MSSPLLEAGASRPRSGILSPSSDGSLNGNDAPKPLDKFKRRRSDSVAMDHLLKPPIALKVGGSLLSRVISNAKTCHSLIQQSFMYNPASSNR